MSLPLIDCRAKITEKTDVWLRIESRRSGISESELIRNILHDHASRKINEAILLCNALDEQGISRDLEG